MIHGTYHCVPRLWKAGVGHRARLLAMTLRQHQIKPPNKKPTAMLRQDAIKYKRYRSVLHSDTLYGDGTCGITVRHQEGFRACPRTGKAGSCAFKASDQSSAKLTLIVNTRESSVWVKTCRIHQDIAKRKITFLLVRVDPLG